MPEQCTLQFETPISIEIQVGSRFGKLTVSGPICSDGKQRCYPCRCDCGRVLLRPIHRMRQSKSCHQCFNGRSHGATRNHQTERLYSVWQGIKRRCFNPSEPSYSRYGGKGVIICQEWLKYAAFREWSLTNGYAEGLSIDRIDGNGNYEPGNCRWATDKVQSQNRSCCVWVTAFGETKVMADWINDPRCPISAATYKKRIRKGWTPYDALFTPPQPAGAGPFPLDANGQRLRQSRFKNR